MLLEPRHAHLSSLPTAEALLAAVILFKSGIQLVFVHVAVSGWFTETGMAAFDVQ